jgi:cytochrome c556
MHHNQEIRPLVNGLEMSPLTLEKLLGDCEAGVQCQTCGLVHAIVMDRAPALPNRTITAECWRCGEHSLHKVQTPHLIITRNKVNYNRPRRIAWIKPKLKRVRVECIYCHEQRDLVLIAAEAVVATVLLNCSCVAAAEKTQHKILSRTDISNERPAILQCMSCLDRKEVVLDANALLSSQALHPCDCVDGEPTPHVILGLGRIK